MYVRASHACLGSWVYVLRSQLAPRLHPIACADNKSCYASWFGGNLQGVQKHPINLHGDGNERVVVSALSLRVSILFQHL